MPFKVKLDADAKAVPMKDGKQLFVKDDGTEIEIDVEKTYMTVGSLRGESQERREKLQLMETQLQAWQGLGVEAADAKKALDTVKAFNGKQAIDAGEIERQRADAAAAVEAKYKPVVERSAGLEKQLQNVSIGNAFGNSKFISEKVAEHIPRDMLQAQFAGNFEMKDGKLVAKLNGNPVYSPSSPAELASFDEALEVMVNAYPNKAQILKGTGAGGSGSRGSGGVGPGGKIEITRAQFEALGPAEQMATLKTSVVV